MKAMFAKTVSAKSIGESERQTMYGLMQQYYECMAWDRFNKDLDDKDDVILLMDKETGTIKGFSTLKNVEIKIGKSKAFGVFSGDTVVDRAFWGQRVLGKAFLRYLFLQKARRPFTPFYWILISKGYKTYLLLANNFSEHYPRYEQETPRDAQSLMDRFATSLFGDAYNCDTGLIHFTESLGQLREGIADVPTGTSFQNPRIAYFAKQNPTWADGSELMCIARMTWAMPLYYVCKSWWKLMARPFLKRAALKSKNLPEIAG
jgi:hypothetical protein